MEDININKNLPLIIIILAMGIFSYIYIQNKESRYEKIMVEQQKTLEGVKSEIKDFKYPTQENSNKILSEKKLTEQVNPIIDSDKTTQYDTIKGADISSYLTSLVEVICNATTGSGFFYKINSSPYIITNEHVVSNPFNNNKCMVTLEDSNHQTIGFYEIIISEKLSWNKHTDVAIFPIHIDNRFPSDTTIPISELNYKLSSLPSCPSNNSIGAPVAIFGFPAFSKQEIQFQGKSYGVQTILSITSGTISGYDTSIQKPYGFLPYSNYQVTAKIDSGNSGGIALSRNDKGVLCLLGIPTWLTVGNFETIGIIQNLNNIFYTE